MISVVITTSDRKRLCPQLEELIQTGLDGVNFHLNICEGFPDRYLGGLKCQDEILIFLDEDCYLEPEAIGEIRSHLEKYPEIGALVGKYQSRISGPRIVSAYNKLCSAWVGASKANFLLGGAVAIRRQWLPCLQVSDQVWGGEDGQIALKLMAAKVQRESPEFYRVRHEGSALIQKFFKRAWRHGQARTPVYGHRPTSMKVFFTELKNEKPTATEIFFIALHLLIVEVSSFLNTPKISPSR